MSLSSFDGTSPLPTDLATKYEKLAAEYAKIRAHVGVLKKAVVEEQTRCAELREENKSKDQIIRKNDQEYDSLSFRNQQLTKRVTVLQEELDHLQGAGRKGRAAKSNTNANGPDTTVMQEELLKKITDNMKLVTLLEETKLEFEQERQRWQGEVDACKKLLRNNLKEEKLCECDNLRRALATAEAALKEIKENRPTVIIKGRTTSQRVISAVNDLPIMNFSNSIFELISSCTKLAPDSPKIEQFKPELSHSCSSDEALPCLVSYHCSLQRIVVLVSDTNAQAMLRDVDSLLADFRKALNCCLKKNLDLAAGEEALATLGDAARSLTSSLQYHLSLLKEVWEDRIGRPPYDVILKALTDVHGSSMAVWKYSSDCVHMFNSTDTSFPSTADIVENKPCEECQRIARKYEETIFSLQSKIKHMTATADSLLSLKKPVSGDGATNDITNDIGRCISPTETAWPEEVVREMVLRKTSATFEERQIAESKLTKYIAEREAAIERMMANEEECKSQKDLIASLQEELATTKRNYEDHLSSMSEHMANMNDRLTAQQSQIEELTYEVTSKGSKKGRQK